MRIARLAVFLMASLGAGNAALHAQRTQSVPPPDNTKVNKQGGQTADQQSQSKADLALTQRIRRAIMKDKTLSTDGHDCKIITQQGAVTLRGPVKTPKEKETINDIALKIAGAGNVTNELTVKPVK